MRRSPDARSVKRTKRGVFEQSQRNNESLRDTYATEISATGPAQTQNVTLSIVARGRSDRRCSWRQSLGTLTLLIFQQRQMPEPRLCVPGYWSCEPPARARHAKLAAKNKSPAFRPGLFVNG